MNLLNKNINKVFDCSISVYFIGIMIFKLKSRRRSLGKGRGVNNRNALHSRTQSRKSEPAGVHQFA